VKEIFKDFISLSELGYMHTEEELLSSALNCLIKKINVNINVIAAYIDYCDKLVFFYYEICDI
jgi:hypothetical protein